MAHEVDVDRSDALDPDDAFTLLADETRLQILRALGDAWSPRDRAPLSFSELRDRADVADGGRFNYHLTRLVGTFVRRVEDGYWLTYPGVRVYQAIASGAFNEHLAVDPFEIDDDCVICGASLVASYEDHLLSIACPACDHRFVRNYVPPGRVAEGDPDAFLVAVDQTIRRSTAAATAGVCADCSGTVAVAVGPNVGYILPESAPEYDVRVTFDCEHCSAHVENTVGSTLLSHPAVISFAYERGLSLADQYVWTIPFVVDPDSTTLRSTDPLRVAVTVEAGGDSRRFVVDEALDVVAVEE